MQSFWMPKNQPLYAPMLSTFGGGSARGFGAGLSSGSGGGLQFSTQTAFSGGYSSQLMFNVDSYRGMMLVYEDTLSTGDDHIILSSEQGSSGNTFNGNTRYYRRTATSTLTLQNSVNIGSLSTGSGARDSAYYLDTSGNYNIYIPGYTGPQGFVHIRTNSLSNLTSNWSTATVVNSYNITNGSPWSSAVDQARGYLYIGCYTGDVQRYSLNTSNGVPTSTSPSYNTTSNGGVPCNTTVAYDPWADVLYTGSDYNNSPVICVLDGSNPSTKLGEIQIYNNNDWQTSIGCLEVSETKLYFQANENSHDPNANPVYAISR